MRKIMVGAAALGLLATMGVTGCGVATTGAGQTATGQTQAITYTVTGKTAGNLTYTTDGAGSTQQESDVKLPWTKTINVSNGFAFVSVLAQNGGSGEISCKITRADGTVIKEATSKGQYVIASCSGSVTAG